jgi:hypothetical protein
MSDSDVMYGMHSPTSTKNLWKDSKFWDHAFSPRSKQVGVPACDAFLDGFNAAVFAYGQTGSGKTHTMFGDLGGGSEGAGLIPRSLERIFSRIETLRSGGCIVTCSCTHVEIYNEQVRATTTINTSLPTSISLSPSLPSSLSLSLSLSLQSIINPSPVSLVPISTYIHVRPAHAAAGTLPPRTEADTSDRLRQSVA